MEGASPEGNLQRVVYKGVLAILEDESHFPDVLSWTDHPEQHLIRGFSSQHDLQLPITNNEQVVPCIAIPEELAHHADPVTGEDEFALESANAGGNGKGAAKPAPPPCVSPAPRSWPGTTWPISWRSAKRA